MKKHNKVSILFLTFLLALSFSFAVSAKDETITDGKWSYIVLEDETAKITKYTGSEKEVTIPESFGDVTVSALGPELFRRAEKTEKVTVPNSVVTMERSFYMADSIKEIYIGKGLKELVGNAFFCAWSLEKITVDEENESFLSDNGVLYTKDMKKLITVPSGVKADEFVVPDGVEVLGESAMRDAQIAKVKLPDSLKTIESFAISLKKLKELTIPSGVEEMKEWAVYFCNDLVSVKFEDGRLTEIGDMVFESCEKLGRIHISSNITKVGKIINCPGIKAYSVSEDNENMTAMDGVLFNKDMTELLSYPCGKTEKSYTIPKQVEIIGENSFYAAKNLASVYMPESIKVIKPFAFAYCSALADVYYDGSQAQFKNIEIDEETVFFSNVVYMADHTHNYNSVKVTKKATNKANGKVQYTCSCGDTYSETVYKISSIKLSTSKYTYNGKVRTPDVTVKNSKGKALKKNTDYTVKYGSGRKQPGRYKVTVTFKGKYNYTEELSFVIAPKTPTLKVTTTKGKVTLNYTQLAGVTGYQIYYSTDGKTYKNLATVSKTKYTKTFKSGKKYYFKVRGYVKPSKGSAVYGAFSSVKSIKVK